jgi:hypothetical protein
MAVPRQHPGAEIGHSQTQNWLPTGTIHFKANWIRAHRRPRPQGRWSGIAAAAPVSSPPRLGPFCNLRFGLRALDLPNVFLVQPFLFDRPANAVFNQALSNVGWAF